MIPNDKPTMVIPFCIFADSSSFSFNNNSKRNKNESTNMSKDEDEAGLRWKNDGKEMNVGVVKFDFVDETMMMSLLIYGKVS